MNATLICAFIGLAIGNFAAQQFTGQNWSVAIDRSFFQAVALLTFYALSTRGPQ